MSIIERLKDYLSSDYKYLGNIGIFEVEEVRSGLYHVHFYNAEVYSHKETEELDIRRQGRVLKHVTSEEVWENTKSIGEGSPWKWGDIRHFTGPNDVKTYNCDALPEALEEDL